jgi:hypothetical protein
MKKNKISLYVCVRVKGQKNMKLKAILIHVNQIFSISGSRRV